MTCLSAEKNKTIPQKIVCFLLLYVFVSVHNLYGVDGQQSKTESRQEMLESITATESEACFSWRMSAFMSRVETGEQAVEQLVDALHSSFINKHGGDCFASEKSNLTTAVYNFISEIFSFTEDKKKPSYKEYMVTLFSLKAYLHNKDKIEGIRLELLIALQVFFADKLAWAIKDKWVKPTDKITDEDVYCVKLKKHELKTVTTKKHAIESVGKERKHPDNIGNQNTKDCLILGATLKRLHRELSLKEAQLMRDIEALQKKQNVLEASKIQDSLFLAYHNVEPVILPRIIIQDFGEQLCKGDQVVMNPLSKDVGRKMLSPDDIDNRSTKDYPTPLYPDLNLSRSVINGSHASSKKDMPAHDVGGQEGSQAILATKMQGSSLLEYSASVGAVKSDSIIPNTSIESSEKQYRTNCSYLDDLCAFLNRDVTGESGDVDNKVKRRELTVWLMSLPSEYLKEYSRLAQKKLMKKYQKSHRKDFCEYVVSLHFQIEPALPDKFDGKIYHWLKTLRERADSLKKG